MIGVTVAGSLVLTAALFAVYLISRSQIALAQATDSVSDALGGAILLWAVYAGLRPADEDHPGGHGRAGSIAALIVAVLTAVLAAEVLRSAISALLSGARPDLDGYAAAVFAIKVLFKALIAALAGRGLRRERSAALTALRVDARNDMLAGLLALLGFAVARAGLPRIDAGMAVGFALYIAYSGLRLGRENASLLLGESASKERRELLVHKAREVQGVLGARDVVAIWQGPQLRVELTIQVSGSVALSQAHAIGHAVERLLLQAPDVGEVRVHVEPSAER